jgi:thiol-disulfide isomerase/thioredoxin
MFVTLSRKPAALAFIGPLLVAASAFAFAEGRPADAILRDYDAAELPKFERERRDEPGYVERFRKSYIEAQNRRDELAWELFQAAPEHKRVPALLLQRWQDRMIEPVSAEATAREIDRALPRFTDPKQARDARFLRVVAIITKNHEHPRDSLPDLDQFIRDDPRDPRGATLLNGFASTVKDMAFKTELLRRLVAEYPKTSAARDAENYLNLAKKIGKPFSLAFDDAVKGTHHSIEGLKGKVVVLDFWATWCGPCVAEMPRMKKLYAEFHDKGVEFIGVSLDEPKQNGGLDKLKEFVAKHEIPWPQYYQGNGWESEFSSGLGINAIPRLFLVDADGKLAEIEARGKLETLLPKYLARAKGETATGGK